MIRFLVFLLLAGALAYCGATVKLGKRTFFGHIQAIWETEQVQDLKQGVQDKAGPAARELKNKVHDLTADDPAPAGSGSSAGSGSAAPATP